MDWRQGTLGTAIRAQQIKQGQRLQGSAVQEETKRRNHEQTIEHVDAKTGSN
ncbi:hypothetical protein [Olivibacter domesticus]|uniref:hypothetical protein n=1 Tax=Olivibacter domesticus TaxID=407022 RepID=UPI0013900C18|nr:hypothetical protein [Olivibacter domesticus]